MFMIHGYIPPILLDEYAHPIDTYEMDLSTAAMLMKHLWDTWDYGGNENFLREKVYPLLKELAIFYSAYVQKWEDGYFHAQPSFVQERFGLYYQCKYNTDAAASLAMVKWTLRRAAEASELLGSDSELRPRWLLIADNMAPFSDGIVFRAQKDESYLIKSISD